LITTAFPLLPSLFHGRFLGFVALTQTPFKYSSRYIIIDYIRVSYLTIRDSIVVFSAWRLSSRTTPRELVSCLYVLSINLVYIS